MSQLNYFETQMAQMLNQPVWNGLIEYFEKQIKEELDGLLAKRLYGENAIADANFLFGKIQGIREVLNLPKEFVRIANSR